MHKLSFNHNRVNSHPQNKLYSTTKYTYLSKDKRVAGNKSLEHLGILENKKVAQNKEKTRKKETKPKVC